jgi:hypothetical protein
VRFLWLARLLAATAGGWGAVIWLMNATDPQDARARLALVIALLCGLYGLISLVAIALAQFWGPLRGLPSPRAYGEYQGLLWAALIVTFVLLRLSGELSAAATVAALAAFGYAQWSALGRAP